jgi:formyl-CoA transferase
MGREDLIGDPNYATPDARTERREEVDAIVAAWTRQHDKHEAMRLVASATIPAGAVMDTMELANDKTFEQRGIRQTMQHPVVGPYTMSGWPVRFSGRTPPISAAPLLGQHSEEALADWLGLARDELGKLRQDAVIGG